MLVREAQRRADAAADTFDSVDFVHARTRGALLQRLDPILVDASLVLDLGTATGAGCQPLARRFRRARVVGIDVSRNMLRQARRKQGWLGRHRLVQADARQLPFADRSVDVIFSNLLLPWIVPPDGLFVEVARILRADGLFAFSTLGPDSLAELRRASEFAGIETPAAPFEDMHDVGDAAVRAGLRDPVLDVDRVDITYRDARALFADLTAMGARGWRQPVRRGLIGSDRFAAMLGALEAGRTEGILRFGLEIIYGHCWGSGRSSAPGEFRVDPAQIRRRRR